MTLNPQFIDMIHNLGEPSLDGLIEALSSSAAQVSIRFNPAKSRLITPYAGSPVPWCDKGLLLDRRPDFTFDPLMHQGCYYVQDASSMFIAHVVSHLVASQPGPKLYLDACAAPGGKTTAAAAALPEGSFIVANEFVPQRAAILAENIAKWGNPLITVTGGDTARFSALPPVFDIIAADVPCSGEGMMRKDSEAAAQWTPDLVNRCAATQRTILNNLWPALKPGGYLIYSTCTFNTTENELMLQHLVDSFGALPVDIPVDPQWNITPGFASNLPCFRFIPGRIRGEGLFLGVVRKPLDHKAAAPARSNLRKSTRSAASQSSSTIPSHVKKWIDAPCPVDWSVNSRQEVIATLRPPIAPPAFPFLPTLHVATVKGRDFIPTQQLALSSMLRSDAFPTVDIDYATAIHYLSAQAITLPPAAPKSFVLLRYNGVPLGFVKNIGSRANNIYPRQWRILSSPPQSPSLPPLTFRS